MSKKEILIDHVDNLVNSRCMQEHLEFEAKISESDRRIFEKSKALHDIENELELLKDQQYEIIQSRPHSLLEMILDDNVLNGIRMRDTGFDKSGLKIDKRKKYSELKSLERTESLFNSVFNIDDAKITDLSYYGYNKDGIYYEFTSNGNTWRLYVPIYRTISKALYENAGTYWFKYHLDHKDSEMSYTNIGTTFYSEDLADMMKKGIEKYTEANIEEE